MVDQIARNPKQAGEAVHRRRRSLGMTQKDIAGKTGLRPATISGVEAGEPGTQLRTLFDILTALDMEVVFRPRTKASTKKIEDLF
jgi:HTH-type transcriptional regulator / antitoxin HipB